MVKEWKDMEVITKYIGRPTRGVMCAEEIRVSQDERRRDKKEGTDLERRGRNGSIQSYVMSEPTSWICPGHYTPKCKSMRLIQPQDGAYYQIAR